MWLVIIPVWILIGISMFIIIKLALGGSITGEDVPLLILFAFLGFIAIVMLFLYFIFGENLDFSKIFQKERK